MTSPRRWCLRSVNTAAEQALTGRYSRALARVLAARGVRDEDELDTALTGLLPPQDMLGLRPAAQRLLEAIYAQERVLVVGDFDADGATATAVAIRGLRALGLQDVRFLVPNRFDYGYGLTTPLVEVAAKESPDVLMTVDNGIAAVEGVASARCLGIDVIVTDHHLPGQQIPQDCLIVNPNQTGCDFPSKNLAGVGVVFYLLLALRSLMREQGAFSSSVVEPNLAELLDIVALGTVADVVPLDRNNRVLVSQGLARIRAGRCCSGIRALFQVAKRDIARAQASDLGFAVGPRLNAAGRLDDMSLGIACLLTDSMDVAMAHAQALDEWNQTRRDIESEMRDQAEQQLMVWDEQEGDAFPEAVVLFDPDWHAGVIGILAARVREQTHKPVVTFAPGDEGLLKGSARSVPGLHIRDALVRLDHDKPGLLVKFGGHAMAAGMSIEAGRLDEFTQALQHAVQDQRQGESLEPILWLDGELSVDNASLAFARQLEAFPWGQRFEEPVFSGVFRVMSSRVLKEKHQKAVLAAPWGGTVDAIHFHADLQRWPEPGDSCELAYKLNINRFRGVESLQLMVEDLRGVGES